MVRFGRGGSVRLARPSDTPARRFRGIPLSPSPFRRPRGFSQGRAGICVRRNRPLGSARAPMAMGSASPMLPPRRAASFRRPRGVRGFTAGGRDRVRWSRGWTGGGGDAPGGHDWALMGTGRRPGAIFPASSLVHGSGEQLRPNRARPRRCLALHCGLSFFPWSV